VDKPVQECQTILDVAAARDDGDGSGANWNSNMCSDLVSAEEDFV